jgi:4-hydroxy-tetrahydrodipicolinate synthase
MARSLGGKRLFAAIATPVEGVFRCDVGRLADRALLLAAHGVEGFALFGTTGEGPGFAAPERRRVLDAVLDRGIAPDTVVAGVSAAGIEESLDLADHAASRGVVSVLATPPFFLAGAAREDGIAQFYDMLVERLAGRAPVILYHIPSVSGIALTPSLIRRVLDRHGDAISGIKDSGGDRAHTLALCAAFPDLDVLAGQETDIPDAMAAGAAGTICGLANNIPGLMARLFEDPAALDGVRAVDQLADTGPFVPTVKAMVAIATGDDAWSVPLPPRARRDPAEMLAQVQALDHDLRARWGHGIV